MDGDANDGRAPAGPRPMTLQPQLSDAPSEKMARFVLRLEHLVEEERRTQEQRIHQQWERPLGERTEAGRALAGLRVVEIERGLISLHCPHNESRFREGDMLRLNRGDPFAGPVYDASLEREEGPRLWVALEDGNANWALFEHEPDDWVADEGYLDLSHFYFEALYEAAGSAVGRARVLPILMGLRAPGIDFDAYERMAAWARRQPTPPNGKQEEALAYAYAADSHYLIQGPPGTGKTHVLALLAQRLAQEGERVMVTSFTHRAINNALNKIARVAPAQPTIKIGFPSPARTDDLEVENHPSFGGSPLAELDGGYIVGATPFATRSGRLDGVQFDTIIFDEASQITLPLAIMAMLQGTPEARYIFIGDHRQMPPVLMTDGPDSAIRRSVFSALKGDLDREDGTSTMLDTTYRLNAPLCDWPSRHFYHSRLRTAPAARARRLTLPTPPPRHQSILDPRHSLVFVDLAHRGRRARSDEEAAAIADLVRTLLAAGLPPDEIGIVALFRAQGRAIRTHLAAGGTDRRILRRLVVDTVERMQGQEREVVLLSLTTSDLPYARLIADFLFQPERLNVSVTRPRTKLIIVGSRHLLDVDRGEPEPMPNVARLRDLVASAVHCTFDPASTGVLS